MSGADDIARAHRLADAAAAAIRPHFRNRAEVESKADASPVTIADRDAETAMRAIIAAECPADAIIGEEFGNAAGTSNRTWVFDPIDGTRSFISGRPLFGTLIALLEDGVPVLGVIDQCISGERWIGADGKAWLNGSRITTRACPELRQAHLATTAPHLFDAAGQAGFQRVRGAARDSIYGGDCYNYALLATGCLDVVIEAGLKVYDWAALVPVVTGAGGAMCDWDGAPLRLGSDGRVFAAGDAALINQVRARL